MKRIGKIKYIYKRIFAISACIALVLLLLCACVTTGSPDLNRSRQINSVNHRGYYTAPENTLSAFRLSKEFGFDMVECDVRFTADNVPVLLHDAGVARTSNGTGKVNKMTFGNVRALDFGGWKGKEYRGEKIPTFDEFMELCAELSLYPYVEIKNGASESQIELLTHIADGFNVSVTWIARSADYLSQIHKLRPNDRIGLLVDIVTEKVVNKALQISPELSFINANYHFLTKSKIRLCQRKNIPLEIWTVDNKHIITDIDVYISGITSNKFNAEAIFSQI